MALTLAIVWVLPFMITETKTKVTISLYRRNLYLESKGKMKGLQLE